MGLHIDRVFEHGEALAYIRLVLGYANPLPAENPSIRQIRFNFVESINPFASHSMRLLACGLANSESPEELRAVLQTFQQDGAVAQ